jgi:hypothetical protein
MITKYKTWKLYESVLNNFDRVLTDTFLRKFLEDVLILDYFSNLYKSELELDSDYKINPEDSKFISWLKEELLFRLDIIKQTILEQIRKDNTLKLWRKMMVPSNWLSESDRNIKLGKYWTWDKDSAGSYASDMSKGNEVLLEALVESDYIDWIGTFRASLDPLHWGEEQEIRLIEDSPINLISATVKNKIKLPISGIKFRV